MFSTEATIPLPQVFPQVLRGDALPFLAVPSTFAGSRFSPTFPQVPFFLVVLDSFHLSERVLVPFAAVSKAPKFDPTASLGPSHPLFGCLRGTPPPGDLDIHRYLLPDPIETSAPSVRHGVPPRHLPARDRARHRGSSRAASGQRGPRGCPRRRILEEYSFGRKEVGRRMRPMRMPHPSACGYERGGGGGRRRGPDGS